MSEFAPCMLNQRREITKCKDCMEKEFAVITRNEETEFMLLLLQCSTRLCPKMFRLRQAKMFAMRSALFQESIYIVRFGTCLKDMTKSSAQNEVQVEERNASGCARTNAARRKSHSEFSMTINTYGPKVRGNSRQCNVCLQSRENEFAEQAAKTTGQVQKKARH